MYIIQNPRLQFNNINVCSPANHGQSQFRFDNECNISLPENHKRVSETAPKLENVEIPQLPDLETPPENPSDPETPIDASQEDTKSTETEEACVVVKEDATPRGRRMADEAREVAAAHASLLVDIEACKRVSMSRRLLLSLMSSAYVFVIVEFSLSVTSLPVGCSRTNGFHCT